MTIETEQQGENFTHKALWSVVARQIENAEGRPTGSAYDDLAAMVFAALAFEAYLNFLGERLAPDLWREERKHFRGSGFAGKIREIFKLCKLDEPDRRNRPYSTIWKLKCLRDQMAHGKTQAISNTFRHNRDEDRLMPPWRFEGLVSHAKAIEAMEDVHAIALILHAAAKPCVSDTWFGDDPFSGAHAYMSSFSQKL